MSDDEAVKLARRAITLAAYRDSGSGGFCNSKSLHKFFVSYSKVCLFKFLLRNIKLRF